MSITPYFDITIDTKRITDTASTDNQKYETNLTSVKAHIQPLDDSFNEDLEGSYGKDFLMFCEVVDIKQEDIIVHGSVEYIVKGVESYSFIGQEHLEVRIRKTQ